MSTPDYRIRFPSPTIDFSGEVGITGQDHDNYPSPGTQARYDWMRLVLIGLLSHQASESPPSQYREGTIWMDLNTPELKIWMGDTTTGSWHPISDAINVALADTTPITLTTLYSQFLDLQTRVARLEGK